MYHAARRGPRRWAAGAPRDRRGDGRAERCWGGATGSARCFSPSPSPPWSGCGSAAAGRRRRRTTAAT